MLKMMVDREYSRLRDDDDDLEVVIVTRDPSLGFTSAMPAHNAQRGIDWDNRRFLVWPEKPLVKKKDHP